MLSQLSDHGISLVKNVPVDDEEIIRKVKHSLKSSVAGLLHSYFRCQSTTLYHRLKAHAHPLVITQFNVVLDSDRVPRHK